MLRPSRSRLLLSIFVLSLTVSSIVRELALHCWHDDARARLLHTRTDQLWWGATVIGTRDVPCIIRDAKDRFDCNPVSITIDTKLPKRPLRFDFPNWASLSYIGLEADLDTSKMNSDPCKDTQAKERLVAKIIDRDHHRTVYVPCEGMVYVVPNDARVARDRPRGARTSDQRDSTLTRAISVAGSEAM